MELVLIKENEDGSADFDMKLTQFEVQQLVRVGIIEVLKRAVEEGKQYECSKEEKQYECSEVSVGNTGCGEASCKDGSCEQSCKSEQR
jgi:hypothetical protein